MRTPILILMCLSFLAPCTAGAACEPNIPADLSGDCQVDFNDFAILACDWLHDSDAQPETKWLARFNGPGNDVDWAEAIAVDSNDNIYVTGASIGSGTGWDCTTIKYSPDSNQPVWVARYNGPDNGNDGGHAIALDSNNNIYVTGTSYGSVAGNDCLTIKYSPDSNQPLWVAKYNGPGNYIDVAQAIAVNSNDNIYVTGYSDGSAINYPDYATIKYSPDSNQPVWVARYSAPGNSTERAMAMAVDSNDNIYVTGLGGGDYATIKYSPDSNQPVWVARYNGPGNSFDSARAIAIDSNDNIYVTGYSVGPGTSYDYATIKYSPDSNQPVWVARYNGPGNDNDLGCDIAVDSNNNIYVTGYSDGFGTYHDYATIKYSPDSNRPVWVARYTGPGMAESSTAIAIDSSDNIYVTGNSEGSGTSYDYTTIKYSPDSNQPVWVARYNGPGSGPDIGRDIAIDSSDNIYVTGRSNGSDTSTDYATIKYSPDHTCTPPVTGDFDLDCDVDIYDLETFCQSWLESTFEPPAFAGCPSADLTGDCWVDFIDFGVIGDQWLNGYDWNDVNALAQQWLTTDPCVPDDMAYIPDGEFEMGDHFSEGDSDELPVHAVLLDAFFMGKYEVTNRQYCDYLNAAYDSGDIKVVSGAVYASSDDPCDYPYCDTHSADAGSQIDYNEVSGTFSVRTKAGRDMSDDPMLVVGWHGTAAYCNWRSGEEGYESCYNLSTWECDFSKHGYRLPTEAEWEYAARGGLSAKRFPWADPNISHIQANYYSNVSFPYDVSQTRGYHPDYNDGIYPYTAPVGSFAANRYGLYDMSGNVAEWCNDWHNSTYYDVSPYNNPQGPASGTYQVERGGYWGGPAWMCTAASRAYNGIQWPRSPFLGFRIVLDLN